MFRLATHLLQLWQADKKSKFGNTQSREGKYMRSIILYVLGVPVTIIVLIALFTHHF